MSVLIKGVGMPKNCAVCPFQVTLFGCSACIAVKEVRRIYEADLPGVDSEERRPSWCPLVPVPTPHGRLIDADALRDTDNFIHKTMVFGGQMVYSQSAIDNAPTIIEAEGEDK